ncbi:hypothetical protein ACS0TY_033832 [Phlomoides rotata]
MLVKNAPADVVKAAYPVSFDSVIRIVLLSNNHNEMQVSIRGLLLASLEDPHKMICTAVSVAISTITQYDWPDDWPELLPFFLSLLNDQTKFKAA